mmetsp:Transcript_43456/g.80963  ORF Transcript_43456/g.80963 Transcript_43456/m.80963 type:complete len:99 (+) Transcript_43456:132-428(+)
MHHTVFHFCAGRQLAAKNQNYTAKPWCFHLRENCLKRLGTQNINGTPSYGRAWPQCTPMQICSAPNDGASLWVYCIQRMRLAPVALILLKGHEHKAIT